MSRSAAEVAAEHLTAAGIDVSPSDADESWLLTGPSGVERSYDVLARTAVTTASVAALRTDPDRPLLVVADHVADSAAEVLRARDVAFVDTAGNMHLTMPGVLIDVRGRRRVKPAVAADDDPSGVFTPRGLRVLLSLLSDRSTAGAPLRVTAERSGASLGTVQGVVKGLERQGHLEGAGRRRELRGTRRLFDRWVEAYLLRLGPRLTTYRFSGPDGSWWQRADSTLADDDALWGGETAAAVLDGWLRPAVTTIYARGLPRHTVVAHRLRRDEAGDVVVRDRFWNWEPSGAQRTTPSPLVYADLIATGDPRCLEAATRLRENDAVLGDLDRA